MRNPSFLLLTVAGCADVGAIDVGDPLRCDASDDGLMVVFEGAYVAQGATIDGERGDCEAIAHPTAGARGSRLAVSLDAWTDEALISATDAAGRPVLAPTAAVAGDTVSFDLLQSGEVLVRLEPRRHDAAGAPYALSVACEDGCDRAYTRYPILLMHGMGGGSTLIGGDYFYGVRDLLTSDGYVVRNPGVDAYATSEQRAVAWQVHVDAIVADGLGRRVNLVAHSQGGIDARALASSMGDARVASIVTIGTPHRGTLVAEAFTGTVSGLDPDAVNAAVQAVADIYGADADDPDFAGQLAQLSSDTMAAFNDANPDRDDVTYRSWAGSTCTVFDQACVDSHDGESVDPLIAPMFYLLNGASIDSDGLVPVTSAEWTGFAGVIFADHADEIGQFQDEPTPAFDHRAFYRDQAAWLRENAL